MSLPQIIHPSHVSPRQDNAIVTETVMNPQVSMENVDKKRRKVGELHKSVLYEY
jgi:hypothetical protein